MSEASEILIIIVACALTLFLIVLSVAGIKIIQVLHSLQRITAQGEKIADSAEAVGELFRKSTGPAALVRALANVTETVVKHKRKEE